MAWLAGSVGFCLSVHIHGASTVPCGTGRSNPANTECETALARSGARIQRNKLPASPTPPQKHSLQIFLGNLMLLQFLKIAEAGWKVKNGDGGQSLNESLIQWNLILQVCEKVAIYKK